MYRRAHPAWLEVRIALWLLAIALAAGRCTLAQTQAPTVEQKAAAAVARGLHLDAGLQQIEKDLQLLGAPASLPVGAGLHLISARPGFTPGTWLLRLDCVWRRDCLPFHALLRVSDIGVPVPPRLQPVSAWLTVVPKSPSQPGPSVVLLARSGDRVNLVEELSGMRLRVQAVCLQSGALGDRIRVQNLATHRILLATIAGQNLVRVE